MKYIYTVYFYDTLQSYPTVYPVGFYDDIENAKKRLDQIIPDYNPGINHTVCGNYRIGWINKNVIGELNTDLSASQPHSAVCLFD